ADGFSTTCRRELKTRPCRDHHGGRRVRAAEGQGMTDQEIDQEIESVYEAIMYTLEDRASDLAG
ncbi:DUF768 domain-containing protein, partial [Mesorhizobium sp. M2D.F.Ca.ET.145.01.1.1]